MCLDKAELAQLLGEAFRVYSFQVSQGGIHPWERLMTEQSINVKMTFNGRKIGFTEIVEPLKESAPEAEVPIAEPVTTDVAKPFHEILSDTQFEEPPKPKPKRTRKKKTPVEVNK